MFTQKNILNQLKDNYFFEIKNGGAICHKENIKLNGISYKPEYLGDIA